MQTKIYCLNVLLLFSLFTKAQKPEFFREEISFGIDSVFFSVNGDYYFRNNSDASRTFVINYPVRKNSSEKPIDTIMIFDNADFTQPIKVNVEDTLALFAFNMLPHSEKVIKIIYRQKHNGKKAQYILLTTKFWEKPFEKADYNLVVDKNIEIIDFSILPDSFINYGNTSIYYWKKENFMPEKDFEINFNLQGK